MCMRNVPKKRDKKEIPGGLEITVCVLVGAFKFLCKILDTLNKIVPKNRSIKDM